MKKEKLDKKRLKKNLLKVWQYMKQDKKYIILFGVITIIQTGIGIILPLISAKLILYLTNGLFSELLLTSIVILIISTIDSIFYYLSNYYNDLVNNSTTNRIQIAFAREFLKLEIKEIDKSSTGTFAEMINYDASGMSYVFFRLTNEFGSWLAKAGTVVTVFILNKYVFVYCMIVAFVTFLLGEFRNRRSEKYWLKMRSTREEKNSLINELVRGIRDIKVLNAREAVMKKTEEKITEVTKESFLSNRFSSRFSVFNSFFRQITNCGFFLLGIILCKNELLTISTFLILYNYQGSLSYVFSGITNFSSTLREFNMSASRIFDVIEGRNYQKENFGTKKVKHIDGLIEFKDVTFSYDGKKDVIKKMNFTVKPNEVVGFVGKSGAGKSTIFNLITKLYSTNNGSILIDSININELDETSLRDNMSIITQNPYIFNFSIKDNLLLANPKASMKEIRNACKLAAIDDFIMELDDKYDTKLGENGLILSGGQKQRLAIARALLMKTEIMLFDEATSSLDNETQGYIQDAINNLKGQYTILIIAHRLSTVVDSDKLFIVDNGKIVGEGTHKELIKDNKIYQKLYQKESS